MKYEDRLVLIFQGKKVNYYTTSLEDTVISKLCSGRKNDMEDVEVVANKVDWDLLEKLATDEDELKANIMNDKDYFFFFENYKDYVRRFKT